MKYKKIYLWLLGIFLIPIILILLAVIVLVLYFANPFGIANYILYGADQQVSLKTMSSYEAWQEYDRRRSIDPNYDWSVAIRFYGQVFDQYNQPVVGAEAEMRWTDHSLRGTSVRTVRTDKDGKFSLTNVRGKMFVIDIEKEGYYGIRNSENQYAFEFASPTEDIYYEPDENNPQKFLMRKKGKPIAMLKRKFIMGKMARDGTAASRWINFLERTRSGEAASSGQMQLTAWRPPQPERPPWVYPIDWRIRLEFPDGGGLIPYTGESALEAPESGYEKVFDKSFHVKDPMSKQIEVFRGRFYFCFGEPLQYGRMDIEAAGVDNWVRVEYLLNPTLGDRNIEPDPTREIKLP